MYQFTVVEPIVVVSDVDTVTCAGDISITDPQVCPGRSITFTCTTNETGNLLWRTSASSADGIFFIDAIDDVGSMGSELGEGLPGFTATLTAEMGLLLTSTLTTAASDDIRGLQVMCLDSTIPTAASESANIPPFVEGKHLLASFDNFICKLSIVCALCIILCLVSTYMYMQIHTTVGGSGLIHAVCTACILH